jgi:methionyl-tRNA formyltransferase
MSNPAQGLRLVFAGTPEFAAAHLAALIPGRHQLAAIYTQPDRPAGRGRRLQASPVKQLALQHGLAVMQPASLKSEDARRQLAELQPDLMIVVAYGLLLPQAVLDIPRYGCINVHASLLPRWRGAAPIQRAVQAGDPETGITIMQMDAGLDTGNMLASCRCPIGTDTTAASLHDELQQLGPPLLTRVLDDLPRYAANASAQNDELATYAHKILKQEAQLDWQRDAAALDRDIRAFNPFPVCYTTLGEQRLKVHAARPLPGNPDGVDAGIIQQADADGIVVNCGAGRLSLQQLQLPGGKALGVREIFNARRDLFTPGTRLGPD